MQSNHQSYEAIPYYDANHSYEKSTAEGSNNIVKLNAHNRINIC